MKDSDFQRIDLDKLSQMPERAGAYNLIKNTWWLVDKDGKGLRFKGVSYQHNQNEHVGKGLIGKKVPGHPAVSQIFIENILVPIRL